MRTLSTRIAETYGGRWRVFALWYVEICLMVAALWALVHRATPASMVAPFAFLVLCGAVLALPSHALRLAMAAVGLRPSHRRLGLQFLLAFAAAATAASLSTQHGWAAIVSILLIGNALWGLDLDLHGD
jgi:hypothetical protein